MPQELEPSCERNMKIPEMSIYVPVLIGVSLLIYSGAAFAYLGPGAGLGMIGSLIAIVFVALAIVLGLVIYPIKLLRKNRKARAVQDEDPIA